MKQSERVFVNDAFYAVIDNEGDSDVVYHRNGEFYMTGSNRTYSVDKFKYIGEKLDITFPTLK